MSLKTFATNEEITSAALNSMLDDMPDSIVYCATPQSTTFGGGGGGVPVIVGTLKLRPLLGSFLFFRFEAQRGSGNTQALVSFTARVANTDIVTQLAQVTVTAATWTKYLAWSPDLANLLILHNACGTDVDIETSITTSGNQGEMRGLVVQGSATNITRDVGQI